MLRLSSVNSSIWSHSKTRRWTAKGYETTTAKIHPKSQQRSGTEEIGTITSSTVSTASPTMRCLAKVYTIHNNQNTNYSPNRFKKRTAKMLLNQTQKRVSVGIILIFNTLKATNQKHRSSGRAFLTRTHRRKYCQMTCATPAYCNSHVIGARTLSTPTHMATFNKVPSNRSRHKGAV